MATVDAAAAPPRAPEYRALDRARGGGLAATWAIARWTLRPLLRRWPFWALLGLGWIGFLTSFAFIYIKAEIAAQNPAIAKALDSFRLTGTAEAYRIFLFYQGRAVELAFAYVGVAAILNDFRTGGLSFYLSKPVSRWHYALGKLAALAAVAGFVTLVPGILLWLAAGWFNDGWEYWSRNLHALRGIAGYSAAIMVAESLALLALASWFRKPAPMLVCWATLFAGLPTIAEALEFQFRSRAWGLLSLWRDIGLIGAKAFGQTLRAEDGPLVKSAFAIVAAVAALAALAVRRNLRAVEVVE